MGRTPDRYPGPREETEVQFFEQAEAPTVDGAMRYVSGAFSMKDSVGVFNPRAGLPVPGEAGEILFAASDSSFTAETPLTSDAGWLVNNDGILLIVG